MSEERIDQGEEPGLAGFKRDIAVGIASLVVGAWVAWYSQGLPPAPGGGAGSGLFPTMIGTFLAGVGILLGGRAVVGAVRSRSSEPATVNLAEVPGPGVAGTTAGEQTEAERKGAPEAVTRRRWSNSIATLGAIILYIVLIEPLGFIITMSLVQFGLLLKFGNRILPSLAISAISTATLYLLFGQLLFVPLQSGLLG